VAIFPTLIDFGEVAVGGASQIETLTLRNLEQHALLISRVLISGHAPASFREQHSGTGIEAGGMLPIQVTFTPEAKGARFANLTVEFSDGSSAGPAQLSGYGR